MLNAEGATIGEVNRERAERIGVPNFSQLLAGHLSLTSVLKMHDIVRRRARQSAEARVV